MNNYLINKERLRQQALAIKQDIINKQLAWWDYLDAINSLCEQAKKYGLIKEFKKLGIM